MMMHWSHPKIFNLWLSKLMKKKPKAGAGNDDSFDEDNTVQFNEETRHLDQHNKSWKKIQIRGTHKNSYKL